MQFNYRLEKNVHSFQQLNEPHSHDDYEILLCLSDGGRFEMQGMEYPLCRGMLFFLPNGVSHRCIVDTASYERYVLHFSPDTLWTLSDTSANLMSVFDGGRHCAVLDAEQLALLERLMDACLRESGEFAQGLERNIAFMQIILAVSRIARNEEQLAVPALSREFAKMMPIIQYIHQHYREEISLEQISQTFFVSKYHLCRQFKAITGFTVGAYITNYRVRQACELLRSGSTVQSAGETVGFGNNAHFIHTFGQIIGVSPGKYARASASRKPQPGGETGSKSAKG